jgi:hypothetical protein
MAGRTSSIVWRATKSSPCPVCGGDHACAATRDDLYFCWRTHRDIAGWFYFGDSANGFGLLRDTGRVGGTDIPRPSRNGQAGAARAKAKPRVEVVPDAILAAAKAGPDELMRLASRLGVHHDALQRLGTGYEPQTSERDPEHWLFAERDDLGRVIGLTRRYANGHKMQYPGTRRGLTFDPAQDFAWQAVVLVPEGASDVAAALTMHLCAVGRPNNLGGVEMLGALLCGPRKAGSSVVILGEHDQKPNGEWPGRDGAIRTAQRLADTWKALWRTLCHRKGTRTSDPGSWRSGPA